MSRDLDRRSFLKLVGGGIVVFVRLRPSDALAQGRGYPTDLNAYLRIDEDGRVTVFSGKIEMGQGVMTSLAQMAAEDLGVSLDVDRDDHGRHRPLPLRHGDVRVTHHPHVRPRAARGGRRGRLVLVRLASEQLGVPKDRLVVENGIVSVKGEPARKVSYGALAKGRAITRTVDEKAVLRAVPDFTVMGRSPRRLDAVDKVTGAGKYAADIPPPGPAARAHPAPARARGDPRPRGHIRGREAGRRDGRQPGRDRRRAARGPGARGGGPRGACDRSGTRRRPGRTRRASSPICSDERARRR